MWFTERWLDRMTLIVWKYLFCRFDLAYETRRLGTKAVRHPTFILCTSLTDTSNNFFVTCPSLFTQSGVFFVPRFPFMYICNFSRSLPLNSENERTTEIYCGSICLLHQRNCWTKGDAVWYWNPHRKLTQIQLIFVSKRIALINKPIFVLAINEYMLVSLFKITLFLCDSLHGRYAILKKKNTVHTILLNPGSAEPWVFARYAYMSANWVHFEQWNNFLFSCKRILILILL